jgi:hypothetical protein
MSVPNGVGILTLFWGWLFGVNFLVTSWRFPRFLARSLARSGA